MKSLFFSLLVLLTCCLDSTSANATLLPFHLSLMTECSPSHLNEGGIFKFKLHFVRGIRNEAGICHDRGICEFETKLSFRTTNPDDLDVEFEKDPYGNILLLISKSGMSTDAHIDITGFPEGPGIFYLSNASDIPNEVKVEFGLPAKYQVNPGRYQVTETPMYFIVNFRQ